jgi:pimeloyl-ACP methyl ester carboxylesterase
MANLFELSEGYITPMSINGLNGRMLYMPATDKKHKTNHILAIYGHHSSLERMFSIVENMAEYGNVTMPDLPGFGGMESLFKIGEKPDLDTMADYLATFIKLKMKNKRFTIVGMSYGFLVAARCLQKNPELQKNITGVMSLVGFTCIHDFSISKRRINTYKVITKIFSTPPGAAIFKLCLSSPIIKTTYRLQASTHPKMKGATKQELKERLNFEVYLWQCNDARTYMFTTNHFTVADIRGTRINVPLAHISVSNDQYFDNESVKRNLSNIFTGVSFHEAVMPNHAPTVISTKEEAASFIPDSARAVLARQFSSK